MYSLGGRLELGKARARVPSPQPISWPRPVPGERSQDSGSQSLGRATFNGSGEETNAGTLASAPTPRCHTSVGFFSSFLNIIPGILILLLNTPSGNIY